MQDSSTILIFTSTEPEPVEMRRSRASVPEMARNAADRAVEVSTDALKNSVLQTYRNCMEMIRELPGSSGAGVLESVTFNLAINGEGQVGLLSTSAKVGAQVGLTFQVRINPPASGQ